MPLVDCVTHQNYRHQNVLYSHKSTLLHAWAGSSANGLGLDKDDSILMVVPMFHNGGAYLTLVL